MESSSYNTPCILTYMSHCHYHINIVSSLKVPTKKIYSDTPDLDLWTPSIPRDENSEPLFIHTFLDFFYTLSQWTNSDTCATYETYLNNFKSRLTTGSNRTFKDYTTMFQEDGKGLSLRFILSMCFLLIIWYFINV